MPIPIDDSAYPNPGIPPLFQDVPVDTSVRREDGSYVHKFSASQATQFSNGAPVTVPGDEHVQPVTAAVTITAPAP